MAKNDFPENHNTNQSPGTSSRESFSSDNFSMTPLYAAGQKTSAPSGKSNRLLIVSLSVLLVILVILGVLTFLYYSHIGPFSGTKGAGSHKKSPTGTELTDHGNSAEASQEGNASSADISDNINETPISPDEDFCRYLGYWRVRDNSETELNVISMGNDYADISLWMNKICSFEHIHVQLDNNKGDINASSDKGYISGTIDFLDASVVIELTDCDVSGLGSHSEWFFSEHSNTSVRSSFSIEEATDALTDSVSGDGSGNNNKTDFSPYILKIQNSDLSIYDSPSYSANIVGEIKDKGSYTIVEEYQEPGKTSSLYSWGKLKSGAGWINLSDAVADDQMSSYVDRSGETLRGKVITKDDDLNVRESPSTDSEKIGTVAKGQTVEITGETQDWYEIKYKNGHGFVYGEYIELIP